MHPLFVVMYAVVRSQSGEDVVAISDQVVPVAIAMPPVAASHLSDCAAANSKALIASAAGVLSNSPVPQGAGCVVLGTVTESKADSTLLHLSADLSGMLLLLWF